MIDTHAHLNFKAFEDDWEEVLDRAIAAGVEKMIVVGTNEATSRRAIELAEKREELYATVGIHPHHATSEIGSIRELARHKKVVAIGEVGLDYYMNQNKNLQKKLFGEMIRLAKEVKKPLIIHSREAGEEVLDAIEHFCKSDGKLPKGVWHCFAGGKKYVKKILERGFYVSFTGNVTYAAGSDQVAKMVPLERLLLETDCPYLTPYKEKRRCEPRDVIIIGQFHAKERGVSKTEIDKVTTQNAEQLFNFKV